MRNILVKSASELPDLMHSNTVFADFETTSCNTKKKSTNPWRDCWIAGLGITADKCPDVWYIPVGHRDPKWNIDFEAFCAWLYDVLSTTKQWTNQNVKYDAHVAANCAGVVVGEETILKCTLTQAKIIDSDRMFKGGYGIDVLARDWLKKDITHHARAMAPYLHNNKDYGRIPADIMCEYCCDDVRTGRQLDHYIESVMPEESRRVSNNEIELTSLLFEMEREGMRVEPSTLKLKELECMNKMLQLDEKMEAITGQAFRPNANEDCYDIICNQYGAPVLGLTEEGNPSFNKEALANYLTCTDVPTELIQLIMEYRTLDTFISFFVAPYQELHVDSTLHPIYNQAVRTGRLSCKAPNAQQLNKLAKELIIPREGYSFLSVDDSQIEFRTIAHYLKNAKVLQAYQDDPWTDYHQLVADMVGISRKPAKTMNFLLAFGGGKGMVESALASNLDLVGHLEEEARRVAPTPDEVNATFRILRKAKATDTYNDYHKMLPELKAVSKSAERVCQQRGYVRNLLGRRRCLPYNAAYRAFNTLNQSSAADLMKERLVGLRRKLMGTPIKFVAQVHDEVLLTGPTELIRDERTLLGVISHMESPDVPELRVPIRCSYGYSEQNWREASSGEQRYMWEHAGNFDHLR